MNTESQQQIAREAAESIDIMFDRKLDATDDMAAIILKQIERASGKPDEPPQVAPDVKETTAQPQRSDVVMTRTQFTKSGKVEKHDVTEADIQRIEQQEWTPNYVARIYAFADGNKSSQHVAAMTRTFVTGWQTIADAHNAALTAAVREAILNDVGAEGSEYILRLERELVAERQRREQALNEVSHQLNVNLALHQQLLSALAAIEQYRWIIRGIAAPKLGHAFRSCNKPCTGNPKQFCPTCLAKYSKTLEAVDLSLLHEHDAEVRKPLVDALDALLDTSKEVDGSFPTEAHLNARRIAVRLLAKVKQ